MTQSLPQGTVTFLFTDIEGSTRLWEYQPTAMQVALARHYQILESIVENNNGTQVKSTGDGMLAVFTSASDAILASIEAQRLLMSEQWSPEIGDLAVRMAVHSGAAQLRAGDYYGPSANRAARLLDAGHGGQIILSSTTRSLVRESLPPNTSLLDLGQHRLRDIMRPERIYQLAAPGFQRDFPPLKTQPVYLSNLPPQSTPFIGRKKEVTDVTSMIKREGIQLITLTGSGGAGKTRLALEAAAGLNSEFTDGIFFVDLASLTSPESVQLAVAETLGLRPATDQNIGEIIRTHLANLETLFILDNFEHLLSESMTGQYATDMVMDLLAAAPNLKLLVTSRETLNLPGEWQYPVTGLSVPTSNESGALSDYDALQLFDACARRVRPGFSLSNEADGVVAICRAVEGIPLAIELAASWINSLNTYEIAVEIQKSIDFLSTSQRGIPRRHRSMQAVFEYSLNLLNPKERDVFTHLSVFEGGFSRDAAAHVAEASLPVLSSLLDKSLIRWEEGRYYYHGLLRQFAAERLQAEFKSEIYENAHCLYFANFMSGQFGSLLGGKQLEAVTEIKREIGNIRVAWKQAVDTINVDAIFKLTQPIGLYYQMQSQYQEAQITLLLAYEQLISKEAAGREIDMSLAMILVDLGWIEIRLGYLREATKYLTRCQQIYECLDIPPIPGHGTDPRLALAIIDLIKGDYETAAKRGVQALNQANEHDHRSNRQFAHYILNQAAMAQGQIEAARQHATMAYSISQDLEDRWFMAYCLNELGNIASAQGDYPGAAGYYQVSYSLREEFDDAEGMALALMHLGEGALSMNALAEAQHSFERAVEFYEEIYDKGGLAKALNYLARTAAAQNDIHRAADHYQRAIKIAHGIQYKPLILSILSGIAQLFITLGREELGLEVLTGVCTHPATEYDTRIQAEKLLAEARANLADLEIGKVEDDHPADLDELLPRVRSSLVALEPTVVDRVPESTEAMPAANQTLIEPLTPRELEVLRLIAQGLTNRQIADELYISVGTVKSYTSQIYGKLGVRNRTHAVAHARTINLIE